jgi:hypothetical protein
VSAPEEPPNEQCAPIIRRAFDVRRVLTRKERIKLRHVVLTDPQMHRPGHMGLILGPLSHNAFQRHRALG